MRRTAHLIATACLMLPASGLAQRSSPDAKLSIGHYRAGWQLMRVESWDRAVYEFQQAITLDPKFALAHYSLGRAQMALKKFPAAVEAYVNCRDLYLARAGQQFSNQMEANRHTDDVLLEYEEALRQATPPGQTQSQTASLYVQRLKNEMRQLQDAKSRNQTVTFDNAVPFFVSMSLGAAYFRMERFADAEREYKAAISDNPRSGETHSNLAVLYMTTGRLDEAAREIELAEKTGFKVNPGLKDDLRQKMGKH